MSQRRWVQLVSCSICSLLMIVMTGSWKINAQEGAAAKPKYEDLIRDDLASGKLVELEGKLNQWSQGGAEWQVVVSGRLRLAQQFIKTGAKEGAVRQAEALQSFSRFLHEKQKDLVAASMVVVQADSLLRAVGQADVADTQVSGILARFVPSGDAALPTDLALTRSLLRRLQASQLKGNKQEQEAVRLLQQDLQELRKFQAADLQNPERSAQVVLALVASALVVEADQQEAIYNEIQSFGLSELKRAASVPVLYAYLSATTNFISGVNSRDPDRAMELLEPVRQQVGQLAARPEDAELTKALESGRKTLEEIQQSIQRAIELKKLLSTQIPELEVKHWVNGPKLGGDDFKGKVLLIHFWAVWHQPSLNMLPQLEGIAKEYGDKLQVIGVTLPYGLLWDASTQKVVKPQTEVTPEQEIEMLGEVSQQLKLSFPTMLLEKGSTLPSQLGVSNIPHMVLVDQDRKIHMILVGQAAGNLKQIRDSIDKVLSPESK